jgi:tetratricopeptide (TPR) repeat protein
MSLARSGVTLLLALAALAAPASASADPPPPPQLKVAVPSSSGPQAAPNPAPAGPAHAADKDKAKEAMVLHDEAWELYEQGRYRAAVEKLEAALRLDPEGRELVYNIALLHEKLGELPQASRYYRRYLEMETDPKTRARIQGILRRLDGAEREASERAGTRSAASASGLPPLRESAPPAPPPPRPVKPWVIATGSIAAGAFFFGSIFGLSALAKNPGTGARTGAGVTISDLQSDARAAHTDAVLADISFLVALGAAGTAMFLYFSTPRQAGHDGAASGPKPPRAGARVNFAAPGVLGVSF